MTAYSSDLSYLEQRRKLLERSSKFLLATEKGVSPELRVVLAELVDVRYQIRHINDRSVEVGNRYGS